MDCHIRKSEVLLLSMPFSVLGVPSIGLSLLKPALLQHGVSAKILYLNLRFAQLIGSGPYDQVRSQSNFRGGGSISEWIFAGALFNFSKEDEDKYIDEIFEGESQDGRQSFESVPRSLINVVLSIRDKVNGFLDDCLQEVSEYNPKIVGFSSLFQQHLSSLSLAKKIKTHCPETFILFGGPNCEGVMGAETIRQFPFVDAVVSGEGDIVFPQIVRQVLEKRPVINMPGVYTQSESFPAQSDDTFINAPSVQDMDSLPFPDYDEYFDQLNDYPIRLSQSPQIALETSRGCWWAEKKRCTFCGFSGKKTTYRSKSGQHALNELTYLSKKYNSCAINIVDNILNMNYFRDFIPELINRQHRFEMGAGFTYQVRSNLSKKQVRMLRDGGFVAIQPGIESMSTKVLKCMRKGTTAVQNIQLLKWCKEYGLIPHWNLLWGFPFEPEEEYERMAHLIPLLVHLHPPIYTGNFILNRFSPNFEYAEEFGIKDIIPAPFYRFIYPLEPEVVTNLAFYFKFSYDSPQKVEEYTRPVLKACDSWKRDHDSSDLFYIGEGDSVLVWDQRPLSSEPLTILSGIQKILFSACDCAQSMKQLMKIVEIHIGKPARPEEIDLLLFPMISRQLMIREDNRYLNLAIPVGEYSPEREIFERFQKRYHQEKEFDRLVNLRKKLKINEISQDLKISNYEIKKTL